MSIKINISVMKIAIRPPVFFFFFACLAIITCVPCLSYKSPLFLICIFINKTFKKC